MLSFLPYTLKGIIAVSLLILNTLIMSVPLFFFALLKLLIPVPICQKAMSHIVNNIAELWITFNSAWMRLTQKLDYQIKGLESFDSKGWYLVTANHQSWADITIMQHILNRKIPLMKFFLKRELIWVPVIGLCWWALDFPFVKRYSKSYLKAHPKKKHKNLEATSKACVKFKNTPISIVNYLEGTRFTKTKHQQQKSPFQHLLKPKSGGVGYVIGAMGDQISSMINITISYNQPNIGYWNFLCGQIEQLSVHIEVITIPAEFSGKDYQNDSEFRRVFQLWIHTLWEAKDDRLRSMKKTSGIL
ncbi:MAG: acyltransferase [Candidatus Endonucleobacter sp. (ex Gigantidas childressi)]|nr:acyltransferase [Candidatus Endonucleobacter sp. (ex Gigantidas childressi)]